MAQEPRRVGGSWPVLGSREHQGEAEGLSVTASSEQYQTNRPGQLSPFHTEKSIPRRLEYRSTSSKSQKTPPGKQQIPGRGSYRASSALSTGTLLESSSFVDLSGLREQIIANIMFVGGTFEHIPLGGFRREELLIITHQNSSSSSVSATVIDAARTMQHPVITGRGATSQAAAFVELLWVTAKKVSELLPQCSEIEQSMISDVDDDSSLVLNDHLSIKDIRQQINTNAFVTLSRETGGKQDGGNIFVLIHLGNDPTELTAAVVVKEGNKSRRYITGSSGDDAAAVLGSLLTESSVKIAETLQTSTASGFTAVSSSDEDSTEE